MTPSSFGVVELSNDRLVRQFVEKPTQETSSNLVNAGTYVVEPSVLDRIPADVPVSVERVTFPQLVAEGNSLGFRPRMRGLTLVGRSFYLKANLAYADSAGAVVRSQISTSASLSGVVADGATIEDGAVVKLRMILPNGHRSGCEGRQVVGLGSGVVGGISD